MPLNEAYIKVWVEENLSDMFPLLRMILKKGDALSPLLFNIALEYAIRRVHPNLENLKLNGSHRLLSCADDVSADIV